MEAAHVAAGIGVAGGEGGEVVFAQNPAGGALHSFHIQWCVQCIDVASLPGRAEFSAKNLILIGFCPSTMPGMEIASDPSGAKDTDSRRQNAVERTGEVCLGDGRRQCK